MGHRSGHNENLNNSTEQAELLERFDDDFSEFVALGKRIGPVALNELLEVFGGQKPHIPKANSFWRSLEVTVRNETIRTQFRGNNIEQLALEYELSERQLRNIVAGPRYVRYPTREPPRSLKLSEARFAHVQQVAARNGVTLRAAHEALMAIVLSLPDLQRRVADVLGQRMLFDWQETDRTTDNGKTVTGHA